MQIFKFQRDRCKLSFLFPPRRQCAGELARRLRRRFFALVHVGGDGYYEVIPWKYTNSFPIIAPWLSPYLKTKQEQNRNKKGDKSKKGNFIGNERELHQLLEIKGTPFQSISSVPIHSQAFVILSVPTVGNLSESLCPGVGHLSVLLEAVKKSVHGLDISIKNFFYNYALKRHMYV